MALIANLIAVFSVTIELGSAASIRTQLNASSDATLSTTELIQKYGYPAETHPVTTEDGYILELHRIPFSPKSPAAPKKPPVLVIHALSCSSANWVLNGPANGLGFILADLGYDVWLGNTRGNTYSRKHATLDPQLDGGKFWDFSWHELGVYDSPAMIDFILNHTGQPNLFYIGHSQGTTQFFVLMSERPEYNDKIRAMFGLAPIAYDSHARSPLIRWLGNNIPSRLINAIGFREIFSRSNVFDAVATLSADGNKPAQILFTTVLFSICGFDWKQLNLTSLPALLAHTPAGSSTKQYFHYMQQYSSAKFRRYDYSHQGNLDAYGTATPPNYNLSKITAPVSLHYGSNDWLASPKDVDILHEELKNPIGKFLVPWPEFNHLDFMLAIDVKSLVYDQVTDLMANL